MTLHASLYTNEQARDLVNRSTDDITLMTKCTYISNMFVITFMSPDELESLWCCFSYTNVKGSSRSYTLNEHHTVTHQLYSCMKLLSFCRRVSNLNSWTNSEVYTDIKVYSGSDYYRGPRALADLRVCAGPSLFNLLIYFLVDLLNYFLADLLSHFLVDSRDFHADSNISCFH